MQKRLTKKQQKIYDSIMANFPFTSKKSAMDIAINNGIKFDLISK